MVNKWKDDKDNPARDSNYCDLQWYDFTFLTDEDMKILERIRKCKKKKIHK